MIKRPSTPANAGRALAAARWHGHTKIPWTSIRLRAETRDSLTALSKCLNLTVDETVRRLVADHT